MHSGTLAGGHYVAFAERESGQWYNFNDEYYQNVSENEALRQQAYLLFYRQEENWSWRYSFRGVIWRKLTDARNEWI